MYKKPYYTICNPREENRYTNNFTIPIWILKYYNKDFLFEQVVHGEYICKIVPKEFVKQHAKFRQKSIIKEDGTKTMAYYYLISLNDILAA